MMPWKSANEVLDFAIKKEEEAAEFYTDLAGRMDTPSMKEIFQEFAREELRHKAKLSGVKQSGQMEPAAGKVLDLKIGDYLVDVEPGEDLDYQSALILAMKQEKAAFKLYTDLAAAVDQPDLRELLLSLAQEEAKHKLRFEIEYDERFLAEN